jgi:dihydroxyacid dehydratase/phosphogluconate dehydratase
MGTASTMNAVAEALGLSLTGCAAIPAPYRERGQMAYRTGQRIVDMAYEDLRPSKILTRRPSENAIALVAVIGGSTNAQPHIAAMARHAGRRDHRRRLARAAYDMPLIVNMQPAGKLIWASASTGPAACPPCCGSCCSRAACTPTPDRHRQDHGREPRKAARPTTAR